MPHKNYLLPDAVRALFSAAHINVDQLVTSGELRFQLALFENALKDGQAEWFETNRRGFGTFRDVCDHLGVSHEELRLVVIRALLDGARAAEK